MLHWVIAASVAVFWGIRYTKPKLNQRAATTVPPPQEKEKMRSISATYNRPTVLPSRGYVASTFNQNIKYTPITEVSETDYEGQIKSLNIANRFYYG